MSNREIKYLVLWLRLPPWNIKGTPTGHPPKARAKTPPAVESEKEKEATIVSRKRIQLWNEKQEKKKVAAKSKPHVRSGGARSLLSYPTSVTMNETHEIVAEAMDISATVVRTRNENAAASIVAVPERQSQTGLGEISEGEISDDDDVVSEENKVHQRVLRRSAKAAPNRAFASTVNILLVSRTPKEFADDREVHLEFFLQCR